MAEYEEKFTRLSKYTPEMVNTETKRRGLFQQGLTVEIQDALVTARVDTYAELVKMAQRVKDSKAKVRELQRSAGGQPQKRPGEPSAAPPAKRSATNTLCNYCGKGSHIEKDCWKKARKCLFCGSAEHQIRDCP